MSAEPGRRERLLVLVNGIMRRREDGPPPSPCAARERCPPRPDLDFLPHKYALILCEPLVEDGYFVWPLTKSPMTFGFREREGQKPCRL
jgi:hypothetical protein